MPTGIGSPSPLQRRLWFLEQLESAGVSYVTPYAVRLRGRLDEGALTEALGELLARHPELGLRYVDRDGAPVAIGAPAQRRVPLSRVAVGEGELDRLAGQLPLPDDESGLAATLAEVGPDDHVLVLAVHQSAGGGATAAGLAAELGALYAGDPAPAAPIAPRGGDREPSARWRERLAATPPQDVPADGTRPPVWQASAEAVPFDLPAEFAALAGDDPAAYTAAAHTLLARHSGRWHGVVGLGLPGRTVPLPLDLPAAEPFTDLVQRTAAELDEAGGADAERLAEDLATGTDLSRNPLFGVLVELVDEVPVRFGELRVEPFFVRARVSRYDLVVRVRRHPDGHHTGELEFPTALLNRAGAQRLAARFATLCASAAADPKTAANRLALLPGTERAAALPGANDSAMHIPEAAVHELIAAQAKRNPDMISVRCGEETLTYRELLARADALAAHLRALGARPGDLVGVAVPRGLNLIPTLLGVLEAGAAYVPLDPHHPADRLAHILDDAGVRFLVTTDAVHSGLPPTSGRIVRLAEVAPADRAVERHAPAPGDLAYVIYTSGSTGRPKGVMVPHGALTNFLWSMRNRPGIPEGTAFPAVTTVSFDIAALELFLPLVVGASVVVTERNEARDPDRLAALLSKTDARIMQATPVTWRLLLDSGWNPPEGFTALCGGEKLPPELAKRLCASGARLWDLYGPTETTIWSSTALVADGEVRDFDAVANTTLYVLDDTLEPAPLGAAGELYIGGAGVARGYLGRPGMTAERFVPDPHGDEPGARLYRTGDLARRHPSGRVEILGRTDDQIKIRGFRVEPGEIERVLTAHPGVRAAVVRAVAGATGDLRLVGYISPDPAAPHPTPGKLYIHCARMIPDYMIPAQFVTVETFPTTPNGKIDRNALPEPAAAPPVTTTGRAPRTRAERTVARVLADVLGIAAIGAEDDFFALGGHSLLATRAMSRLRTEFDVDLSVTALFEARTVAGLARRLAAASGSATPVTPAPRTGPLPLSFAQRRLWFLDQLEPGSTEYAEPFAVPLPGPLDLDAARRALGVLLERHEILRTRYPTGPDGDPVQIVDPPAPAELTVERADPGRVFAEELARPFDLAAGPPVRFRLVETETGEHALLVVAHHIATDDRSHEVFAQEFTAAYRGRALPPLPVQYADYAVWQRDRLTGDVLDRELGFWRDRLAGLEPTELPTDRPRPAVRDPRGATLRFTVPPELASRLNELGRGRDATPFMTYLAAFSALLGRYTAQTDLAIGVPVSGRDRPELEGLLGFFVNTIVLRPDLSGDPDFAELLTRVRDTAITSYAHDGLPFELLVEDLAPHRDLSRNPLFQILFAMHEQPPEPGFDRPDIAGAKFDLGCHLTDRADGGLDGRIEYARALFDADTIARFADHFRRLLHAIAEAPDLPVSRISLSEGETPEVPAAPLTRADTVHGLIAARAAETPDAVAVTGNGRSLTYRELDTEANRLAHRLIELGAGPGEYVVIRLPRTAELIVAFLAVLKSGAAYVPVDPGHPRSRLSEVHEDTGARLLIAESTVRTTATLIAVDDPNERARWRTSADPGVRLSTEDLAYVVYTSGSTGRPKGVMVPHGGLANYALWAARELRPETGSPLHSSTAFDLALTALYPTLVAGGPLTLVGGDDAGVDSLAEVLHTRFGLVKLTPTHLDLLTRVLPAETLAAAADCLVLGGEQLRGEQLLPWTRHAPDTRIVNSYGPSETTVACGVHVARAGDLAAGPVPIGRPLPGVALHVLDEAMNPAPVGVPGELFVGGIGVARGYLGNPGLTAERFVPDPYGEPGGRLYRTGDLVRRRADGNLEFLGRLDQQVKISGFRIEPGEIEAALTEHPGVRAAAVIAAEVGAGDRRLAAYLVADGERPEIPELRDRLARRLPAHMVPGLWGWLDELPLLRNGKLDRRALPALTAEAGTEFVAPRTPVERAIAEIWTEVLGVERIGVHDGFFALGGQSLLATRVAARLRERFGVAVPVRDLFTAQTVAAVAELVETAPDATPPIRPVPRTEPLPLSYAQQGLWLLDQLNPGSVDYLVLTALRLRGPLDVPALETALSRIVERHEILRTRYAPDADGVPVQLVDPPAPIRLVPETGDPQRVLADELDRPVDLTSGPVLRARLLKIADDEHVLSLLVHHIAADGWSNGVLAAELDAAYRGEELPELPVQYGDFAAWQRDRLSAGNTEADLAFWRDRLAGLEPTELPGDRPRPPLRDPRGSLLRFSVPPALANRVAEFGRDRGATPFMTYLAGFFALLARYTGKTDLAVGTPVAGRDRPEVDGLIGYFVNTIVLRCNLSEVSSFAELVTRVRELAVDAYAHGELPFEKLVEDLAPDRDLSRNPLFQILFAFREEGEERFRLSGVDVTPEPVPWRTSKFDVILELTRRPDGGLDGVLEYATALFDRATTERLAEHYLRLLTNAVREPETATGRLEILGSAERRAIVHDWNDTAGELGGCVPERIAAQAARTPDRIAVVSDAETLTYAELDARVNRLTHHLRAEGIGAEDVVAVCLPRRVDLVVAILAVNRAGAAYLPLDPDHPAERLAYMLEDSAAKLVIADAEPVPGTPFLRPDDEAIARRSPDPEPFTIDRDTLAYVIYTSGSTGKPKGVALPHHGIANQIKWKTEGVGILPDDRVLLKTAITFDAAGWEIFAPLVLGATVVVAPPGVERDPAAMVETIVRQRATVLQVVPSFLRPIADEPRVGECRSLRMIYSAGEALPAEVCERLQAALPDTELINGYGPTEASIEVTSWTYREGDTGIVPIGYPGFNTRMAVLSPDGDLVPIGVPGELYIAGESLARGYLGRPDLTAKAFVPDPYGPPGSRMYHTGDLARYRADGALEYLGRIDHQVKIRGVRVELGEVESVLSEHPAIAAAVVTTPPGPDGQPWLVAYLVPVAEAPRDAELREYVLDQLPEPYLPSVFVTLDALPLAPSGKIDRNALPVPDGTRSEEDFVPPRTPNEELVAGVWAEVLGLDAVSAADDFFELGGHSLFASRVTNRLRAVAGLELPVRTVFENRTVAALAAVLDGRAAPEASGAITPRTDSGPRALSFAQQRLWFLDRLAPGGAEYHMTWALRLSGPLDVEALTGALHDLFARHDVLRTRYPEDESGNPIQVVEPVTPVRLPVTELADEGRLPSLIRAIAERPFDLASEVPAGPHLIRLGAEEHVFLLVLHHIASDGESERVMTAEFQELYRARVEGRPAGLVPPALQYADYAAWQQERITGAFLERELAHWREKLAGLAPLELPTDRPRPPVRDGQGSTVDFHLPAEIAEPLVALGARRGATPFMTFLTVFGALLHRYTGGTDLAIGTPVAGRGRPELENLIGFFVNTVVLRCVLSGESSFAEALDRIRDTALDAFGHDELPFERLVEDLAPQRDLSRTPLFDVMFEVVGAPQDEPRLPGIEARRITAERTTAKFELTLALTADGEGGYHAELEYATALFDRSTMDRLAGHFRTLAESAAAEPDRPISRLELLTGPERTTLLQDWNAVSKADPGEYLPDAFAAQVARTPDAVAVDDGTERLGYAELDARAEALARRLVVAGAGPEIPVGVYLERSAVAVIAWLAVLKAGSVYVPLDTAQPADRLAFLLDDLDAPIVVTEDRLLEQLGEVRPEVLTVEGEGPLGELPHGDPDQAAYAIYTSGSTGRPKGVLVSHRAYAHHCRVIAGEYDINPGDRVVLLAALTFDVAMDQLAATLLAGATLVIGPKRFWAPAELPDRLAELGVTHMEITPAYYREVMATVSRRDPRLARLRLMNVGSDVITGDDARQWAATELDGRFLCTYGPTEATVTCVTHPVTATEHAEAALPIGRPVPGTRAYVLDPAGNPVPVGVPGELCLGGVRLARGYLRRPGLTAERFVPDPFGDEPGARLYRTGDLVRYRPDGAIEFLGRIDTQVKVRGFRIELGEIEAVLAGHPAVRAAAVAAPEITPGDRRLVGYVVPQPGTEVSAGELRSFLRGRLPEYLVPGLWTTLDELPLTASRKVDRRALPVPDPAVTDTGRDQVAPRTEVEEAIAEVWTEVLGVPKTGVEDDFFELGGHSLLATRVMARLRDLFGLDIPLRLFFEATTVATQAEALEALAEAEVADLPENEVQALFSQAGDHEF